MKDLVLYIVKALVDNPAQASVQEVLGEETQILEIKVEPSDRGKVIGKEGRIIKAIRIIVNAAAAKTTRKRVSVEIVE